MYHPSVNRPQSLQFHDNQTSSKNDSVSSHRTYRCSTRSWQPHLLEVVHKCYMVTPHIHNQQSEATKPWSWRHTLAILLLQHRFTYIWPKALYSPTKAPFTRGDNCPLEAQIDLLPIDWRSFKGVFTLSNCLGVNGRMNNRRAPIYYHCR